MDTLLDREDDPDDRFTIDKEILWSKINRINRKSASGTTGWTNTAISALLGQCTVGDANARAQTLVRSSDSFARVIDSALNGTMHASVAEIWTCGQSGTDTQAWST